jgi:hypothetical protein
MKRCPFGAIFTHDDLKIAAAAAQLAAEYVDSIIRAERPHARKLTTVEREHLNDLRGSAREYRNHLRKLERVRKAKRRG